MQAEFKELLEALEAKIAPAVEAAVKQAVLVAGGPVVAAVATPVIDAVDAYVQGLITGTTPAVTSTEDPIVSLQKHVAALTVASGHATSTALAAVKTASAPLAPPKAEADAPQA
jgi:hypothetical protein